MKRTTTCGLALCLALAGRMRGEEVVLLRTGFEQGEGKAPSGWTASGGAQWAEFSRSGGRSLELRDWLPDPAVRQVVERYLAADAFDTARVEAEIAADPKKTFWASDPLELSGTPVKLSLWCANNITYMNDESFRMEVGLLRCGEDGSIPFGPDGAFGGAVLNDKSLHFYREQRENYQLYSRSVPDGLLWEYREAVLEPEQGTYRVVFGCRKEPDGQVWIDDLVLTESAGYVTREQRMREAASTARAGAAWQMELNFPVSFNLFAAGDPLEVDVCVLGKDGRPAVRPGMTLEYVVRDWNHNRLADGIVPVESEGRADWQMTATYRGVLDAGGKSYLQNMADAALAYETRMRLLPVELPQAIGEHRGKLLFLHMALRDGGEVMAEDEVTFGIVEQGVQRAENLWRGGKAVGKWAGEPDLDGDYRRKDGPYNGLYFKAGGQWNAVPFSFAPWVRQKEGEPIDLGPAPETVYEDQGHFLNYYILQGYRRWNKIPEWAKDLSEASEKKYGYWTFSKDAYADMVLAIVGRLNRMFPNANAICPTAGEGAWDLWRFELQQYVYPLIKAKYPNTEVGTWYWGADVGTIDRFEGQYDFFDTEFYADPRTVGDEGPRAAKRYSAKVGRELWCSVMEGCALSGSEEQPDSARGVFDFHVHQWAKGTRLLGQFEFGEAYPAADGSPLLRGPMVAKFGGTGHFGGAQRLKITRYDMVDGSNTRPGYTMSGWPDYLPRAFQPALPTLALCNVLRHLDSAVFERHIRLDGVYAFQFERLGKTALFLETKGLDDRNVLLGGAAAPCTTLDIFGYRRRLDPADGKLLLTVGRDPLILLFDEAFPKTALTLERAEDAGIEVTRPVVKMNPGRIAVNLGAGREAELEVLGGSSLAGESGVTAEEGRNASVTIAPREELPSGAYRVHVHARSGEKSVALLSVPLQVQGAGIDAELTGVPMTAASNPALRVRLSNSTPVPAELSVRFADRYTARNDRPVPVERRVTLQPDQAAELDFALDRDRIRLNRDYPMEVDLLLPDGEERTCSGTVFFRGVPRRTAPVAVDGDLSDWPLDRLAPLDPNWLILVSGRGGRFAQRTYGTWEDMTREDGRFRAWFQWDEEGLYFAARVRNARRERPKENPSDFWAQDCMYITLYPERYEPGGSSAMRPIKMHLAMDAAGKPYLVDMHAKVKHPDEIGVKYAVRETDDGYVYEYFMGRPYIGAMKLATGGGFSCSLVGWHTHHCAPTSPQFHTQDCNLMYAFYRHCFDFDGGIEDMARFVLVEE